MKLVKHELAHSKAATEQLRHQVDTLTRDHQATVRERDLSVQKLDLANATIASLKQEKNVQLDDDDRGKHLHALQVRDLRSRLEVALDRAESLARDLTSRTNELKEKTLSVAGLEGRLAVTESSLNSQTEANKSLVLELQNINSQLASERRRLLGATREVQMAALSRDQTADLAKDVQLLREELAAKERENLKLLEEANLANKAAGDRAREEVRSQLEELRAAAAHWERVCQLQYKDIAERTEVHLQCRKECDEVKTARDEADLVVRTLQVELQMSEAKLDLVWPTHRRDCRGLAPDTMKQAFSRFKDQSHLGKGLVAKRGGALDVSGWKNMGPFGTTASHQSPLQEGDAEADSLMAPATREELLAQISELEELNALLVAENEAQRLSNEVLSERIKEGSATKQAELSEAEKRVQDLMSKKDKGEALLTCQTERIHFLEQQVENIKGRVVDSSISVRDLAADETVVELFTGQLLSDAPVQGASGVVPILEGGTGTGTVAAIDSFDELIPTQFCTIDFLLHEPVTTPTVTGFNAFFDTTFAFRIPMDAMLAYYLENRGINVQLHRIRSDSAVAGGGEGPQHFDTVAEGTAMIIDLIGPHLLNSDRPMLKGHVPLFSTGRGIGVPAGRLVASLEFCAVVRTPFTESFKKIVANRRSASAEGGNVSLQSVGGLHDASMSSVGQLKTHLSPSFVSSLQKVKSLKVTIDTFSSSSMLGMHPPVLSIYCLLDGVGEWWANPQLLQPRFDYQYVKAHSFPLPTERALFVALRSSLVFVFFPLESTLSSAGEESSTEQPQTRPTTSYWGSLIQPPSVLLEQEQLAVSLTQTVMSPAGDVLGTLSFSLELSPLEPAPEPTSNANATNTEISAVIEVPDEGSFPTAPAPAPAVPVAMASSAVPAFSPAPPPPPSSGPSKSIAPQPPNSQPPPASLDMQLLQTALGS